MVSTNLSPQNGYVTRYPFFSATKFSWYLEPPVTFSRLETCMIIPGKLRQIFSFISHFFVQIQARSGFVCFCFFFILLSPLRGLSECLGSSPVEVGYLATGWGLQFNVVLHRDRTLLSCLYFLKTLFLRAVLSHGDLQGKRFLIYPLPPRCTTLRTPPTSAAHS